MYDCNGVHSLKRIALDHLETGYWENVKAPFDGIGWYRGFFTHCGHLHVICQNIDGRIDSLYKSVDGEWQHITRFFHRERFAVSVVDSNLIVLGGKVNGEHCNRVQCFHPADETGNAQWQTWPDLPVSSESGSVVQLGTMLHVVGRRGYYKDNLACIVSIDTGKPLEQRKWSTTLLPNIPHACPGACAVLDTMLVAGGRIENIDGGLVGQLDVPYT